MCGLADCVMVVLLGAASFIDVKRKEISVRLLQLISVFSVLTAIICEKNAWSVLGGAAIGVLFLMISRWTREQIGYGDSWLILALGIYAGGENLLWILISASFGAGLFSLIFCMLQKWNRRYTIPFIPFLAAAFIGVVIL